MTTCKPSDYLNWIGETGTMIRRNQPTAAMNLSVGDGVQRLGCLERRGEEKGVDDGDEMKFNFRESEIGEGAKERHEF